LHDAAISARLPQQLAAGSTDLLRQTHLAEACREILVGTVQRTSERETDASLQGLITTRLHLRIRLIESQTGATLRSFERDVRGAGYTESAAETQAVERAASAIRQELSRAQN
jgi:hypothetical protein